MLAAIPRTFFHYTPSPTKYRRGLPSHRHHVTTYVKKTSPKIAARRILSKRWGSSANKTARRQGDHPRRMVPGTFCSEDSAK